MRRSEMCSPSLTVEHRQTYDRPLAVELIRGAKGIYRWVIKYHGHDVKETESILVEMDTCLIRRFIIVPPEEGYGHSGDSP